MQESFYFLNWQILGNYLFIFIEQVYHRDGINIVFLFNDISAGWIINIDPVQSFGRDVAEPFAFFIVNINSKNLNSLGFVLLIDIEESFSNKLTRFTTGIEKIKNYF